MSLGQPDIAQADCLCVRALDPGARPVPRRHVGDDGASFNPKQLDIPLAETEYVIQSDSMADDLGGKAVAIVEAGWRLYADNLARLKSACQPRLERDRLRLNSRKA